MKDGERMLNLMRGKSSKLPWDQYRNLSFLLL